jgi:hypothetical protein
VQESEWREKTKTTVIARKHVATRKKASTLGVTPAPVFNGRDFRNHRLADLGVGPKLLEGADDLAAAEQADQPVVAVDVNCLTTSGRCCETRFGAVSTAHWPAATDASNAGN